MCLLIWRVVLLTIANGALPTFGLKASSIYLLIRHAAVLAIAHGEDFPPKVGFGTRGKLITTEWDAKQKNWKKVYRYEDNKKMYRPPPLHPPLDPWPTRNPFFGSALSHLKNASDTSVYANKQLRETAIDYLRATTDLTDDQIDKIQDTNALRKDKYPASYREKPDMWGIQQYEKNKHLVEKVYRKELKKDSRAMAELVLKAHESLSDLAKGSEVTDLIDAHYRAGVNQLFKGTGEKYFVGNKSGASDPRGNDYGDKEWAEYVELLKKQKVIGLPAGENGKARIDRNVVDFSRLSSGADRRDAVHRLLKGKFENGQKVPLKVLKDYGLPGWFQVQLDFMKQYAKMFNGEGRSGAKRFGYNPGENPGNRKRADEKIQEFRENFYQDSLQAKHEDRLRKDYENYKKMADPRKRLMDPDELAGLEW